MDSRCDKRLPTTWAAAIGCAVLLLSACDNTIDPFTSTAGGPQFAVYGILDTREDTQFVRVSPIIDSAGFNYGESLDAEVTLTDVSTQVRVNMQDSSVAIGGGRRAYIYFTLAPVLAGRTYQLDVFGSTGDTTRVLTQVPGSQNIQVGAPYRGVRSFLSQRVDWIGVSRVRDVEVHYDLETNAGPFRISRPYADPDVSIGEQTVVLLERERDDVLAALPAAVDTSTVALSNVAISAELLSPEWGYAGNRPPVFLAAVSRGAREWTLADSIVVALGYRLP